MSTPDKTYDTFLIHQIMPAVGWQAVYYVEGQHTLAPVHALALVSRWTRSYDTGIDKYSDWQAEENREVVGMEYQVDMRTFDVCDHTSNFCGLLPPGITLEMFTDAHRCHHADARA